ncbi:glycerate kinase type-2 family protein [Marinithermus hydrothermalis]|uniref:Hydroxypyruvate reductase n=1 Tax=Marinithermus hydrothermalis (strain DSM 14884 / JCM 11576 / T1) TaxID=869210 RepID=F2NL26_MARHT|nr:glycerate kinase [Marinithermus hydrothermalis]AEB11429.1 Hydroxypyruvate reductase [Marinithermus hydrothermalis DSM 14884]
MRQHLTQSLHTALEATHPYRLTQAHLPPSAHGRTALLAVGKAALPMLAAAEDHYGPTLTGFGVTRDGHGGPTRYLPLYEAGHPTPDARSLNAANKALELAGRLSPSDHLILLVSGGGSALLAAPWGVSLEEKQALTQALLASGATIQEINAVRKHLSRIKGGRLAQATPAHVTALLLSDVPGDDPSVIASGPTVPDPSTFQEALAVLDRYGLDFPSARRHLERGARGALEETPKPGDPLFERVENRLIGTNQDFLEAARTYWEGVGYRTLILSDRFQGEARELARFHAALVQSIRAHHTPVPPPVVLLSGGEASVTVRGSGRGGRNQEFLLWLAHFLDEAGVWGIAADTDGLDGNTEAAGALLTPHTLARARAAGLSVRDHLERNDAHGFFAALGDLVVTGPTQNNLNDYRALVVV